MLHTPFCVKHIKYDTKYYNIVRIQMKELGEDPRNDDRKPTFKVAFMRFATSCFRIVLAAFFVLSIIQYTKVIKATGGKQRELSGILADYEQQMAILSSKLQNSVLEGTSVGNVDFQLYLYVQKKMHQLEQIVIGKETYADDQAHLAQSVEQIERLTEQKEKILQMLNSHLKEKERQRRAQLFRKAGLKEEFKREKLRNPLSLGNINLHTPYMNPIQLKNIETQLKKERQRLQVAYQLNSFDELPLCVVVTTRNNARNFRFQSNLQSILNQEYSNYKLVVIDDASTDNTATYITSFLRLSSLPHDRYIVVQNKQRMTALPNINRAIKYHCDRDDIAVLVGGDDELLGKQVFKLINSVYTQKDVSIVYTNHFYGHYEAGDIEKGYSRPYSLDQIEHQLYRKVSQKFGYMRSFKVDLFMKIDEKDMKFENGDWINATYDEAILLPMLEMSCGNFQYVEEYVFLYGYGSGNNDGMIRPEEQKKAQEYIRSLPVYKCNLKKKQKV